MATEEQIAVLKRGRTRETSCRHFNGLMNDQCEACVSYQSVRVDGTWKYRYEHSKTVYTLGAAYPCIHQEIGNATCPKFELLSAEEVAQEEAEIQKSIERFGIAMTAIKADSQGKRGVAGEIDCPCCKTGKLRYSIAGCNGHIHAGCTTEGCVSFMQ